MRYVLAKNNIFVSVINDLYPQKWEDGSYTYARRLTQTQKTQFGVSLLHPTTPPDCNPAYQYCCEIDPVFIDGKWCQQWEIKELTQQEANDKKAAKEKEIRDLRNKLLDECDWTQLADAKVNSQLWSNYRQSLRDITLQSGFPFFIVWPEKP